MAVAVPTWTSKPRSRTAVILEAAQTALRQYADAINAPPELRGVTITVKMKNGSCEARTVLVSVESEWLVDKKGVDTDLRV